MNKVRYPVVRPEGPLSTAIADEIERAIKNVKRDEYDRWFRRRWYQALARARDDGERE